MGSKYVVEVSAAGAPQTAEELNKVAAAEKKIADIRAPKDGTPFDAVAKAAPAAAANAQKAAAIITTSTQQIQQAQQKQVQGEVSASQLRAAEEKLQISRAATQFERKLGVSKSEAQALAKARLDERQENRGENALGQFGQVGDLFGQGGSAIGGVGRLAIGASLAVGLAEAVGAARKETRLFAEAQNEASQAFGKGNFGAGAPQIISNIDGMSAHIRQAEKEMDHKLNPEFGDDPMKYLGTKLRGGLDFLGITPERQKDSKFVFDAQREQVRLAANEAVKAGAQTVHASELSASGHNREAAELQRKIALESELEKTAQAGGLPQAQKVALLRQTMRRSELEEQKIKEDNADADAQALRASEAQVQVSREQLAGHTREAEVIQRKAALTEELLALEKNKDISPEDQAARKANAIESAAANEARIAKQQREADAEALASREAAAQTAGMRAGGNEVQAGQVDAGVALWKEISGIMQTSAPLAERIAQAQLAATTAGLNAATAERERATAVEESHKALQAQAQIIAMIAAGDGEGATKAKERLALEQQIAAIRADKNLTPDERTQKMEDAKKVATGQSLANEKARRGLVAEELHDAEARARIDELSATGNTEAAQKLSNQKELADRLLQIEKERRSGALTTAEAEKLGGLARRDAAAKEFGQDRGKFNRDVDRDMQRKAETPQERDARREGERRAASGERAERSRVLSRKENEARKDEGFDKLSTKEKDAKREEWADEYNKKRGLDAEGRRLDDEHRDADRPENDLGKGKPAGPDAKPADGRDAKPGDAPAAGPKAKPAGAPDALQPIPPVPPGEAPSLTDVGHLDVDTSSVAEAQKQAGDAAAKAVADAITSAPKPDMSVVGSAMESYNESVQSQIADLASQISNLRTN